MAEYNDTSGNPKNLISIIIPVYNGGKYLQPMLDSIYAQTYSNIEVIVAYDTKSTDDSLTILKEYSEKYGLIINQAQDTSSGCARNRGFRLAKGEFVIFLDGDDLIVPTYLEDLMEVFVKNPGLNAVCGSFSIAREDNIDKIYRKSLSSKTSTIVCTQDEAFERWLPAKKYLPDEILFTAPWTWLVRRKYVLEHNIRFPDYSYSEDHIFTGELILKSDKIGYTKKKGYIWIMHATSALHRRISYEERCLQEKRFVDDMVELLGDTHPDILARFMMARKIQFDKEYLMRLWDLPYPEFVQKLQEKNVMHLDYCESESVTARASTFCFNHFKWLYHFIHKNISFGHVKNFRIREE